MPRPVPDMPVITHIGLDTKEGTSVFFADSAAAARWTTEGGDVPVGGTSRHKYVWPVRSIELGEAHVGNIVPARTILAPASSMLDKS